MVNTSNIHTSNVMMCLAETEICFHLNPCHIV